MLNLLKFDVKRMKQRVIVVAFKTPLKSKIGNLYLQKFTSASTRWIYWFHIKLSPESEERPPYPRLGGSGQKEGPKSDWISLLRYIQTPELNSPRTDFTHFHFQYSYLSNTSKKIVNVVSICPGQLAVVQVKFALSPLTVSIISIA